MFVSRGKVVEKAGAYDDNTPEVVYSQGQIINLHLLSNEDCNKLKTNIYCHKDSVARLVPIGSQYLAKVLKDF